MPAALAHDDRWTLADYKEGFHKVTKLYKDLKEKGKQELEEVGGRGVMQLVSVTAGVGIGAMRGFLGNKTTGDVEVAGIDVDMAGGVILTIPAMLGLFGKASDVVNQFAGTVNGIVLARETERFIRKSATK